MFADRTGILMGTKTSEPIPKLGQPKQLKFIAVKITGIKYNNTPIIKY
jgi:hypothetical protein